jgi:hypothetical protein
VRFLSCSTTRAALAAALLVTPACAGRSAPAAASAAPAATRADTAKKDLPWKPWKDVVKDARVATGMFTAYLKRDNAYLAIKPDQFDRDYLLVTQLSQGFGDWGFDGGSSMRSDLVRFHRAGDKVELWVVNPWVTAAPNSPMARTAAYSFGHSVAQSFAIASIHDTTSEVLVDLAPFLVSDWVDAGGFFDFVVQALQLRGGVSFDKERSSFLGLRVFPGNLEAEARLTFRATRPLGIATVADYRYIPLGVHYSLIELPATPMRPRYADDRVGYFISAMMDLSRDTAESFFVRYVNRWRLEKKDPSAAVSEPVRPIVFYVDRTVPDEWRPYVRAGILEWNRAFEEAGLKNAIQAPDAPDDTLWSAEDARYSTVRWMANYFATYAIGPSDVDPRTGEILNADILIAASWIQAFQGHYRRFSGPADAVREVFREDSLLRADPAGRLRLCSYASGFEQHAIVLQASLVAAGVIAPGQPVPREYVGQALKELVMHEVGHTLGLRHNFRGTAIIPADRLTDRTFTASEGTSGSVMDYNPPAVSLDRSKQGDYYNATIGSYDRWAIRYAYADAGAATPDAERPGLARIAGEAADPRHLYGSDEDAGFGAFGLDPTITRYDLTSDPLAWGRGYVGLINRLMDSLEYRLVAPGDAYTKLRSGFASMLGTRWQATLYATKFIGGATTARDHRGDPNGRPAIVDVPAARQREALAFITREGLGENAYQFRPELLRRLAPSRWFHWGASPFTGDRIDFPLHEYAFAYQTVLVDLLWDPGVLDRLRDAALRADRPADALSIPEVIDGVTRATWAEAGYGGGAARNAGSIRRDLQRHTLQQLRRMLLSPPLGTPEDARSVARATLVRLGGALDRAAAATGLDASTRAHYADSRERVRQALAASIVQSSGPVR